MRIHPKHQPFRSPARRQRTSPSIGLHCDFHTHKQPDNTMITFTNLPTAKPYQRFYDSFQAALEAEQPHVHAAAISTFDPSKQLVDSRFVNIKYVEGEDFLFFSNFNSPKSAAIAQHDQISALFFWPRTYTQICIHAKIAKVSSERSDAHFINRRAEKNAPAISSTNPSPSTASKR